MLKLNKLGYVLSLCKARARQGELSVLQQFLEITWLQLTRGVGYDIYHYAGLWDREASWATKHSYLSYASYKKKILEINDRKFHGISQCKMLEKGFFRHFGFPTPRYIGTYHRDWGTQEDSSPLQTATDLHHCLQPWIGNRVCFKLLEGANGVGFKAYRVQQEHGATTRLTHLISKEVVNTTTLLEQLQREDQNGWLIEEYIDQHPVLKAFNPTSLNTLRIFVFQRQDGVIDLLPSFLKTGRLDALTDKTEGGGAAVLVNLQTGVLEEAFDWSPAMTPLL